MKFRPLTESEVTFTFEQEWEDIPVRGNAMCSDDAEYDKQVEDEIIARLDRGDINAWFCAKVTASWKGWKASTYLGCCSYGPNDEPKAELLADMKDEALSNLNKELLAQVEREAKGDGRRFAAVEAYARRLYEPRSRGRA